MSKFLIWNVKGVTNKQSVNRVKVLCRIHKISLLAIIEPKMKVEKLLKYQLKLGFSQVIAGTKDIWVMSRDDITMERERRITIKY